MMICSCKVKNSAFVLFYLMSISGCSIVPGKTEYSCSGLPDGVKCMGITEVYERTTGSDYKEESKAAQIIEPTVDPYVDDKTPYYKKQIAQNKSEKFKTEDPIQKIKAFAAKNKHTKKYTMVYEPSADSYVPKVSPVERKRIWIAPWIAKNGVYNGERIAFLKKNVYWSEDEGKFINGYKNNAGNQKKFHPLMGSMQKQ